MSVSRAETGKIILRLGIALLFLWFGINQLVFPQDFMGYLPIWVHTDGSGMHHMMHASIQPIGGASGLLIINGIAEVILGLLLLLGLFTRWAALLLALHLASIAVSLGYNDVAIRDVALAIATLSIFFMGHDSWCLDHKRKLSGRQN